VHWPRVALFDTAIGFPDGLPLLSNVGFEFILATIVRAVAGADPSRHAAETICTWAIPAMGSLACIGAYLVGARIENRAAGVASALLVSVIWALVGVSQIGSIDQNAFEAPLALFTVAAVWDAASPRRRRAPRIVLAGTLIAFSFFAWSGFVIIAGMLAAWAGLQRLADAFARRHPAPAAEPVAGALLFAALLIFLLEATIFGRRALGIEFERLSLFQPLALLGGGAGLLAIAFLFPRAGSPRRPVLAAACLVASGGALFLAARGLSSGIGYVAEGPVPGGSTQEGQSFRVFGVGGLVDSFGVGVAAYFLALTAVAVRAMRDRLRRPGDTLVLTWTAFTALLAAAQYPRYVPHLALPLALALGSIAGSLLVARRRRALAAILALALVGFAAIPPLPTFKPTRVHNPALFYEPAREVLLWARAHTPSAGIERGAPARPAYGVLASWRYGYWIAWLGERPAVGTPLLLRPEERLANARAEALLLGDGASAAGRLAAQRLRYVLATPMMLYADEKMVPRRADGVSLPTASWRRALNTRLLHDDASDAGEGLPCLGHFRLLVESGETWFPETAGPHALPGEPVAAVKLFERVAGARITGRAAPGSQVAARLRLRTRAKREFTFACETRADAAGQFTIVVPYRSSGPNGDGGTAAIGPWEVRRDGNLARVEVTERDVIEGASKAIP